MNDLKHIADRKARWRLRHPGRERERRDLDNESRRIRRGVNRAAGLPASTPLACSEPGCSNPGQVHHEPGHLGGGFSSPCRSCHQLRHTATHDGPGSNGLNRGAGALKQGDGLSHHPRNGHTVTTDGRVIGLRRE